MTESFDELDLSKAGVHRREEILRLALRAAGHRRRRRRMAAIGFCAAMVLLAALSISLPWRSERPIAHRETRPKPASTPSHGIAPGDAKAIVVQMQSDPGLLDRLAIRPGKPAWKMIGDDELLHELAEAGRPAGLEYGRRGEVVVLYR